MEVGQEVCNLLNIVTESLTDKYLGLPSLVGVDRSDCFQHLIERVCTRINGCKEEGLIGSAMETEIRASFITSFCNGEKRRT